MGYEVISTPPPEHKCPPRPILFHRKHGTVIRMSCGHYYEFNSGFGWVPVSEQFAKTIGLE